MMAAWLAATYLGLLALKAGLAVRAARATTPAPIVDLAKVAVVQPILSGDPRLRETLAANLTTMPSALFVWLIDDDDPVALDVCEALRGEHPAARIEIVSSPQPPEGDNPKLFKLDRARALTGSHIFMVVDDDTRMSATSAGAIVSSLDCGDVATALPGCLDDGRWPSALLAQFVNNNAALTYLPLLNVSAAVTINGMAYAMRPDALDRIGGFGSIIRSITDDLAVAEQVLKRGGRICQTAAPVWVETTVADGRHYIRQMHRWYLFALLLFLRQPLPMQALITLLNVVPALLFWGIAIAAASQGSIAAAASVLVLVLLRALVLVWVQRRIYGRAMHRAFLSIVSEWLQPLHLLHAVVQREITWRRRRYRVRVDGAFEGRP